MLLSDYVIVLLAGYSQGAWVAPLAASPVDRARQAILADSVPNADHGMVTFIEDKGEITYTGYAPGYFRAEVSELQRLARVNVETSD